MRSTRRWRCRPISPPASPATPRSCCSRKPAPPASSIPGAARIYVERLTYELARKAWGHIEEVEALGGMAKAIEAGIPKLRIEEAAAKTQARIDAGLQSVIGVNKYQPTDEAPIDVLKVDNSAVRHDAARQAQAAQGASAIRPRCRRRSTRSPAPPTAATAICWRSRSTPRAPRRPSARSPRRWRRCSAATAPRSRRSPASTSGRSA